MLPTAGYLWLFWRYLRGDGWPRETADARRASLRANGLSPEVWTAAIGSGLLGLIWVLVVQQVLNRLVRLPQQIVPDTSQIPAVTLVGLLFMAAIVAGVVEEAAFRGYMQGPIERRHGPIAAILDYWSDVRVRSFCAPGGDARPDAVLCGGRGGLRRPGLHHELDSAEPGASCRGQYVFVPRPVRRGPIGMASDGGAAGVGNRARRDVRGHGGRRHRDRRRGVLGVPGARGRGEDGKNGARAGSGLD